MFQHFLVLRVAQGGGEEVLSRNKGTCLNITKRDVQEPTPLARIITASHWTTEALISWYNLFLSLKLCNKWTFLSDKTIDNVGVFYLLLCTYLKVTIYKGLASMIISLMIKVQTVLLIFPYACLPNVINLRHLFSY